jgi:hypothetical protein
MAALVQIDRFCTARLIATEVRIREEDGVVVSSGAAGRHDCRFPLVREHRMRNGAVKPDTGL